MRGKVYIGTSGWHYKHWLGDFYPEKTPAREMFQLYAKHFNTVEINNTFYHLPTDSTFDSWQNNSPARFLFAVKGSRFITHMKKLKNPQSSTAKFFNGVERLGAKLGPILFQLPPHWEVNLERLEDFLRVLPPAHRYAIEFRDESWLIPEMFDLLRRYNAAFCIHDLGGKQSPLEITATFSYLRFHGPRAAKYSGSYSDEALANWAKQLEDWRKDLRAVYAYFNNDIGGHAIRNAQQLKQSLK
jgi:uncharacterized protein YecE (DUF72 family)